MERNGLFAQQDHAVTDEPQSQKNADEVVTGVNVSTPLIRFFSFLPQDNKPTEHIEACLTSMCV